MTLRHNTRFAPSFVPVEPISAHRAKPLGRPPMAQHRLEARGEAARLLRRARERAGYTREQLAEALCVAPSTVDELEDPDCRGLAIALRDVLAASRHLPRLAGAVAEEIAATAQERRASGVHLCVHAMNVAVEAADVVSVARAAMADGKLSDSESAACLKEIREAHAALDACEAELRATKGAGR